LENIFKCDDCGREFELDYQLELHAKYMHEPKSAYTCDKCGQEFPLKHQLDNHVSNVKHDPNEKPGRDYHGHRPAEPPRKLY
jgi:DNA-directed RNA polymerase subunit RPC12/RpoP